jgi:zinc protease
MLRAVILGLLVVFACPAQQINLAIEHDTLKNGLETIFRVDHKSPIVHINMRFRVGSKDDPPRRAGLAHLFEHLLFHGSGAVSDYSVNVERAGFLEASAHTDYDYTEYWDTVPSNLLERMLWMESNRFAQFLDGLTQQQLDQQRAVVINEKRQKEENGPYWRTESLIRGNLFPADYPYRHTPGGEYDDVRAITLDDVRAFYRAHYSSNNLTIALVGDFDPQQAKGWISKYFGSMAPVFRRAVTAYVPQLDAPRLVEIEDNVPTERAWLVWTAPPYGSRDEAALNVAADLLGANASPLVKALNAKLATAVSFENEEWQDASTFSLRVSIAPGSDLADVEMTVEAELGRFAKDGPDAKELERQKNRYELSRLNGLESMAGLALALLDTRVYFGSISRWSDWSGRLSSVTADDMRQAVRRWLLGRSHLTVHVTPLPATSGNAPVFDRDQPPPIPPAKPYRSPEIQTARLPNGLEIFVVERHELAVIAVEIRFRAGSASSPAKPMVSTLATALLEKGTAARKAIDIQTEGVNLGWNFAADATFESTMAGFYTVRRNLAPAFRLFADMVRNPAYPDDEVERQKKAYLDDLAGQGDFVFFVLAAAFGGQHPLGAFLGSPEKTRSITAQEVRDFHNMFWRPAHAALVFAGDVTLSDAVRMATDAFGDWSGSPPVAPELPPLPPKSGCLFLVDRKDATQTMVAQILPGVPRNSPDYLALRVVNSIYGSLSESRMRQNIRQEKGIAYYSLSSLATYPGLGLWEAHSEVQTDSVGLAIREFQKELTAIVTSRPITSDEFEAARGGVIRSLPDAYRTVWLTAEKIAGDHALRLPLNEDQLLQAEVSSLTLDGINAIARKYARADRAFYVVIGDRSRIEPQLRSLDLGPIVVVQ